MSQEVTSFILRFVRETGSARDPRWRGSVKHVQGAAERQFTRVSEALEFIQEQLAEAALHASDPWLEMARLWGTTVPQLQQAWLERLGEAATQSAAQSAEWRKQFDALWRARVAAEASADLAPRDAAPTEAAAHNAAHDATHDATHDAESHASHSDISARLETVSERLEQLTREVAALREAVAALAAARDA